jgi:hypothetical protein
MDHSTWGFLWCHGESEDLMAKRTKRRYAHELYPLAVEGEARPLSVEVPCLYARAIGHDVHGTSWFSAPAERMLERTEALVGARQIALLADALAQGLTGDEAWTWADSRNDDSGEWVWKRALCYGVTPRAIKPYPCGPEPDHHDHHGPERPGGWREIERVEGKESECVECCEPTPADVSGALLIVSGGREAGS